jgi:2-dehydro-3-deoxygluconokinase
MGLMTGPGHVVLFGELLLRLNPPGVERIVQADSFEVRFSGAEANAGVSLARFGDDVRVVSKVPANEVGDACLAYLRRFGLDIRFVARGGDRLGIYFVESGAAQRPSKVLYDRAASAFACSQSDDYQWDEILDGAAWFHFSGTAPALGTGVVTALETGLAAARARGIRISCDLNYRAKLWPPEDAGRVMARLVPLVDLLIGNEEDAEKVFGISAPGSDVSAGRIVDEGYVSVARQLVDRFGVRFVATTLRESISASHNRWSGLLYDGERAYSSHTYDIAPIVDRIGGGDAFAGALIHGYLAGWGLQRTLDFAVAASCLKHSIPGDFNVVSAVEVEALVTGNESGRVQR